MNISNCGASQFLPIFAERFENPEKGEGILRIGKYSIHSTGGTTDEKQ
ncbi:hypothetical protein V7127_24435 [Bacillus sp. JJ1773]